MKVSALNNVLVMSFQAIHQTYEKYLYLVTPKCQKAESSRGHSLYIKVVSIQHWDAIDADLAAETYEVIKKTVCVHGKIKPRNTTENE